MDPKRVDARRELGRQRHRDRSVRSDRSVERWTGELGVLDANGPVHRLLGPSQRCPRDEELGAIARPRVHEHADRPVGGDRALEPRRHEFDRRALDHDAALGLDHQIVHTRGVGRERAGNDAVAIEAYVDERRASDQDHRRTVALAHAR